jgi:hypothetical protein
MEQPLPKIIISLPLACKLKMQAPLSGFSLLNHQKHSANVLPKGIIVKYVHTCDISLTKFYNSACVNVIKQFPAVTNNSSNKSC